MNFAVFTNWREEQLRAIPSALDCGETNLCKALSSLQPKAGARSTSREIHRCDLARAWLAHYGMQTFDHRAALVCRGVRHALSLIFSTIAAQESILWLPGDVYPVYLELAASAGIKCKSFRTLPKPVLPESQRMSRPEYLLLTNPLKPLGRFLSDDEVAVLRSWLSESRERRVILDCVYDLNAPLHSTTLELWKTGQAVILHSVAKGWLWPKTFGLALFPTISPELSSAFRDDPPDPVQLQLAERLISKESHLPAEIVSRLAHRKDALFRQLPSTVVSSLVLKNHEFSPGCYFFASEMPFEYLLKRYSVVGIPASVFGSDWDGTILTSLSGNSASGNHRREQ